jgi:predicted nucleic acid-binding protein
MKYLLDTNVLRELGRTSPHKNVVAWLKGVAKLRKTKPEPAAALAATVAAIFDAFEGRILPVGRAVASAWGEALGESEKHVDDAGLAATARVHGLVVVTRNVKDFDGRGVNVIDPYKTATRRS